jgi:CBS domain containing-hemolysin-like protein
MSVLGKIPEKGDAFDLPRWSFQVELMEGRRVSQVVARPATPVPD